MADIFDGSYRIIFSSIWVGPVFYIGQLFQSYFISFVVLTTRLFGSSLCVSDVKLFRH